MLTYTVQLQSGQSDATVNGSWRTKPYEYDYGSLSHCVRVNLGGDWGKGWMAPYLNQK